MALPVLPKDVEGGGHLHVLPQRSHCVAHLIWSSKAPWAGLGKAGSVITSCLLTFSQESHYCVLCCSPRKATTVCYATLPGKPPLCAVLLPRPSQTSLAFPMSALSLRGHEARKLLPHSRREHVSWKVSDPESDWEPPGALEGFPDCSPSQSFASVHCPCTLAQRARPFPYSGAYLMAVSPCALFAVPEAQGQQSSSFAQITSIAL